jgi:serine protease Do
MTVHRMNIRSGRAVAHGTAIFAFIIVMALLVAWPAGAQGPQSVAPLAERLSDAVVNISTSQRVRGPSGQALPNVPKGSPFEDLFEDFFNRKGRQAPGSRKVASLGSGFVIDGREGLIVTNNHVIADADEITVIFRDGTKLQVDKVLGRDTKTDLALLKVTPKKPLKEVPFGSSDDIKVGDWVLAIGNPFGLGGSVSIGIISAKQRDIRSGPYDDYLQTDAAINKGNSGGPLFNMDGEVIGVNTAIISPSGGSIGIGFAVPAEVAVSVIDQLRRFGETRRGWFGVRVQSVTEEVAESLGVPPNEGALVASVTQGGPADKAGIKSGDIVLSFDGKQITSVRTLPRVVARTPHGKSVPVELLRGGKKVTLSLEVGRLQEATRTQPPRGGSTQPDTALDKLSIGGMTIEPVSDTLRRVLKLDEKANGLVVSSVAKGSYADREEIKPGFMIVEAGQKSVTTVKELQDVVASTKAAGRNKLRLMIEGPGGQIKFLAAPLI